MELAPGTPGMFPLPPGLMKSDLDAPMVTLVPAVVVSTDPVLDHALRLVGFDRSVIPHHPVFQCLANGGYDTFYHLFYLNPETVRDLSYLNTSVIPSTRTYLRRGDQAALLTLIAYQWYYKGTHDGMSLTTTDWLKITVDDINEFILSSHRDLYLHDWYLVNGYPAACRSPTVHSGSHHTRLLIGGKTTGISSTNHHVVKHMSESDHKTLNMWTLAAPVYPPLLPMATPAGPPHDDTQNTRTQMLLTMPTKQELHEEVHCPVPTSRAPPHDNGHPTTRCLSTMNMAYSYADMHHGDVNRNCHGHDHLVVHALLTSCGEKNIGELAAGHANSFYDKKGTMLMYLRTLSSLDEPPGTRPPAEPPPITWMDPFYKNDPKLHPSFFLFHGEPLSSLLSKSKLDPRSFDYDDFVMYGEVTTTDHINRTENRNLLVCSTNCHAIKKPGLQVDLTTKKVHCSCTNEVGLRYKSILPMPLVNETLLFMYLDGEKVSVRTRMWFWMEHAKKTTTTTTMLRETQFVLLQETLKKFVCTQVKMYITPKWGGVGTCLTSEGTEE